MAGSKRKPTQTNITADAVIMDIRGGGRDSRWYCLPPFRGDPDRTTPRAAHSRYPFYLVSQGHLVGIFDDWQEFSSLFSRYKSLMMCLSVSLKRKPAVSGYPDNGYRGYQSIEEWGIHPHPVDPQFIKTPGVPAPVVKREATTGTSLSFCAPPAPAGPQLPSPAPRGPQLSSPRKAAVNYAIRGGGVVSSSAERTEGRYRELQERGEEPDLIITRSLQAAVVVCAGGGGGVLASP
ncbi:hypothetical protein B0H14DRAFT_2600546 [Mycena olivaceomarginata]|nr:hypothetical protein B0H14DRAFT_2600546 [Mycena olivaceomarginata]